MRLFAFALVVAFGGLLAYGVQYFPMWGDAHSPASTYLSPHYLTHAIDETAVPNIVTAVLADYRGYDTMFETTVVFAAGLACFFLLRVFRTDDPTFRLYRHTPSGITLRIEKGGKFPKESQTFERIDNVWVPHDLIIKITARFVVPFLILFALYVVAHGHHSPGGGFQGGVIIGASIILYAISFNLRIASLRVSEQSAAWLGSIGVLLYAGTGVICMAMGADFLNYGAMAGLLLSDPIMARSHGILIVEIGVAITVSAVMIWIYYILSSAGKLDEGL